MTLKACFLALGTSGVMLRWSQVDAEVGEARVIVGVSLLVED